jgi:hypothetical protein
VRKLLAMLMTLPLFKATAAAIFRETKRRPAAERFVRYFGPSDALDVFARYGFVVQW